jgi:hypothetical protein
MFGYGLCVPEVDTWKSMIRNARLALKAVDGDKGHLPASNDIFSLSVSFESTSSTSMEAMIFLITVVATNSKSKPVWYRKLRDTRDRKQRSYTSTNPTCQLLNQATSSLTLQHVLIIPVSISLQKTGGSSYLSSTPPAATAPIESNILLPRNDQKAEPRPQAEQRSCIPQPDVLPLLLGFLAG